MRWDEVKRDIIVFIVCLLLLLFMHLYARAEDYIEYSQSAYQLVPVWDGIYLRLDCSNDPLLGDLDMGTHDLYFNTTRFDWQDANTFNIYIGVSKIWTAENP